MKNIQDIINNGYASEHDKYELADFITNTDQLGVNIGLDQCDLIIFRAFQTEIAGGYGDMLKASAGEIPKEDNQRGKDLIRVAWRCWQLVYNNELASGIINEAVSMGIITNEEIEQKKKQAAKTEPEMCPMEINIIVGTTIKMLLEKEKINRLFAQADSLKMPE